MGFIKMCSDRALSFCSLKEDYNESGIIIYTAKEYLAFESYKP